MHRLKKRAKLLLCDGALLVATAVMLASGVQLEASGSRETVAVWVHVAIGILFFIGIVWHLYLHFDWKEWVGRLRRQNSQVTRWLAIVGLLTLLSATIATIHWIGSYVHSPIGGVHGKIGFLFTILIIGHIAKRIKFFKLKKKPKI